jgi:BirA family biotin operon repressor/biotin-[acetyl-CoA-carboxylase] ligase
MNNYFFNKIIYFDHIESTNSELLNNDYADKTLVYTFNQTKGRGRFERKWINFKDKSLALSILIKNNYGNNNKNNNYLNINDHLFITALLSISLIEVLKDDLLYKNLNLWIKWPNDIYINNKKLAGVLTETKILNNNNFVMVSGIGININCNKEELKTLNNDATSIFEETGDFIDIKYFTNLFIDKLSQNFIIFFNKDGKNIIKNKWLKYCNIIGKKVEISNFGEEIDKKLIGNITEIDDEGYIYIENKGQKIKILNGDLKVILN